MSCVLRITGADFDVDAFIDKIGMPVYAKTYKGEPIYKSSSKVATMSSTRIIVSEADFDDPEQQIDEAVKFLVKHKDNLKFIATTKEIEFATIDFGINSNLDDDHLIQSIYFTQPLIKVCAELKITIELSIYKPDIQVVLEKRRLEKL